MRRSHHLLRHHKVVCLGPVDTFLTLNRSYSVLRWLDSSWSYSSDRTNSAHAIVILLASELLDGSRSVRIFSRHFRTVSFKPDHATTYAHNCILIFHISIIETLIILVLLGDLTIIKHLIMSLICKATSHHIGLVRNLTVWHHTVSDISAHHNIVFLDDSDATDLVIVSIWIIFNTGLLSLRTTMILLSLNDMTTEHLRIFYFNLWIIEYVIVVVYVFDYLYGLLLTLFLWFRRTTSSLVRTS